MCASEGNKSPNIYKPLNKSIVLHPTSDLIILGKYATSADSILAKSTLAGHKTSHKII